MYQCAKCVMMTASRVRVSCTTAAGILGITARRCDSTNRGPNNKYFVKMKG
jgi:hypothetical protein